MMLKLRSSCAFCFVEDLEIRIGELHFERYQLCEYIELMGLDDSTAWPPHRGEVDSGRGLAHREVRSMGSSLLATTTTRTPKAAISSREDLDRFEEEPS